MFRVWILVMFLCVSKSAAQAVEIDLVTVGNPGNAPDTRYDTPGYGGVDYVYRIGTFEVTAGQYTEFLNAVAATDTYSLYHPSMSFHSQIQRTGSRGSYVYIVDADEDGVEDTDWVDRPVSIVSWGDAARFANWLHNGQCGGGTETGSYFLNGATSEAELMAVMRELDATWVIPSEDEWYKAAYHMNDGVTGNFYEFPTSSNDRPSYVGDGDSIPNPDPGNYATYYGDHRFIGIGPPYYYTEVGEHENSGSPYGTFDQAGNVFEWNEGIGNGEFRRIRGGSYEHMFHMSASEHGGIRPTFESNFLGFRVARVSAPEYNFDHDGDGDVDLHDFAEWQKAFTGPR